MSEQLISLYNLPVGSFGRVKKIKAKGSILTKLLKLGLIGETIVQSERKSPWGDPVAYRIRGAVIALRSEEASKVFVKMC